MATATATAKPKTNGKGPAAVQSANALIIAKGKTTAAAKTAPAPTAGASGYIRVTSDEKLVIDKTSTQAETVRFAKQFPGWFAKLKPGAYAITIRCNITKKTSPKKPAAKKPAPKV
jgi:hypothetical protein